MIVYATSAEDAFQRYDRIWDFALDGSLGPGVYDVPAREDWSVAYVGALYAHVTCTRGHTYIIIWPVGLFAGARRSVCGESRIQMDARND